MPDVTNMPSDKREAVLQAAINEFSERGYEQGSTNRIIQQSGISKGLLFHYLGSKKNVYLFALDHCLQYYVDYVYAKMVNLSPDIMDRIMQISLLKIRMCTTTPQMYRMVVSAWVDTPPELQEEVATRQAKLAEEHFPRLMVEGIDFTRFRKGLDVQKAIELLYSMLEMISNKLMDRYAKEEDRGLSKLDDMNEELKQYLEVLRYGLYEQKENKRDE
ncbi:TetR/AcrR family transcriptional regulator [Marininema halotolerans]|uniref:DNA-binding transcriptional regulator, AcrR family n=1 Tax=Marininema halotolerans TaxID=1155944 RepID=A0A1I6TSF7_9BACL|nr:TetR/AcrR family transcriptional regulator [Marininema halotolerans]SFS92126.1 DNA-binding transcriptional regulator, AcrR family [Marininema halotolerans]